GETFTEEVERGQLALDEIVRPLFRKLKFDRESVVQFWPLGSDRKVVLDPARSFGKPIETTSGVPTSILHAASKSGETVEAIARWYRAPAAGVQDAIEYEAALRLAA
ncbi:MAG: DUF433 domain-containing protein, partial [Vulcanimicrobiaceae bacterium]